MTEPTAHQQTMLDASINGLRLAQPVYSAMRTFTRAQLQVLGLLLGGLVAGFALSARTMGVALIALAICWYVATTADRLYLVLSGLDRGDLMVISDEQARAIPDDELPVFTILLPAFGEPEIMRELLAGVGQLDYPIDRLDIKLLLEAGDDRTVVAAVEGNASAITDVVLVPSAHPQTKPKACNYGLLTARGDLVTIYDAEDVPEPLQLRRVVAAFALLPPEVACIQCKLGYFNERQNLMTRWFSIEYDQWFGYILPALVRSGAPLPLGGTSNHIRRDALVGAGGWDPFNVTEDADLGIRLARLGFRTAVLDSTTLEEANSDPINWVRQRSRWYKGYLQTFLVHTRQPARSIREMGAAGFIRFAAITLGTPTANLLNIVFAMGVVLWLAGRPSWMNALMPTPVYFGSLIAFVLGNTATLYVGVLTTRMDRKPYLLTAVLLSPLYWVLMSAAAVKAFFQLVFAPSYWEKTVHGLSHGK